MKFKKCLLPVAMLASFTLAGCQSNADDHAADVYQTDQLNTKQETKTVNIIFRSTDQKEYHFTFDKNIRLLSGHYYRLYFRNVANLSGEEKVTPDLLAYEELSL